MTVDAAELERRIAALADGAEIVSPDEARRAVAELLEGLDAGSIRAAEKENGDWVARAWVKRGILLGFRIGALVPVSAFGGPSFFDKDTFPLKRLTLESGVRVVPGGTAIRAGCFVAPGVTIMPPA